MSQTDAVISVMEKAGGYATLGYLYEHTDVSDWKTKTPFASIRRIVQDEKNFFRIKPGLWALKSYEKSVLKLFDVKSKSKEPVNEFTHAFYQGLLLQIGNMKNYKTYIPNQDKNKIYLSKELKQYATLTEFYKFTYSDIIDNVKTIDVVWFNERKFPSELWEIEHTTDFKNSLLKFIYLQDFNTRFNIVADMKREREFADKISNPAFDQIRNKVKFLDYNSLIDYHSIKSREYYAAKKFYGIE